MFNNKHFRILIFISFNYIAPNKDINIYKILYLNSVIPKELELRDRVITSIYCDDCSYLPKVEHAGDIFLDNDTGLEYQLMHNGLKVYKDCYYGNWMTTLIKESKGHHEPQEEKLFYEVLKCLPSDAVMIELGSYWGYYSMWLKKYLPNSKVYLVEPDPENIKIGMKNFKLNDMFGAFEQAMVGSESLKNQTFIDWDYKEHQVDSICVDDFAQRHGIDFIHILHSDVQGAEKDMLKGCCNLMSNKKIGYYFVSTHRGRHNECLEILQSYNLDIIASITRGESFSADGLILAKLPEMPLPKDILVTKRSKPFSNVIEGVIKDNALITRRARSFCCMEGMSKHED